MIDTRSMMVRAHSITEKGAAILIDLALHEDQADWNRIKEEVEYIESSTTRLRELLPNTLAERRERKEPNA